MSTDEKSLEQVLWDSANVMRQTMGAADYMNYALGLIFYKHLSDKTLEAAANALVDAGEVEAQDVATEEARQGVYKKYYEAEEFHEDLLETMNMDYEIKPDFTFAALMDSIRKQTFQLESLNQAFRDKAKNTLTQANIQKLFQAYTDRKDVDKFAHVASFEEIQENDFNLNIPRYVDTSEPEPEIDLGEVNREMADTNHQIQAAEKELTDMMEELTTDDPKKAKDLQDLLHLFQ